MKSNPSEFDSYINNELTQTQKSALESILYSGEYNFDQKPPAQAAPAEPAFAEKPSMKPAFAEKTPDTIMHQNQQSVQPQSRQQSRSSNRQRTRESREDRQIPSYESYRQPVKRTGSTRRKNPREADSAVSAARKPGVTRTGAKKNNIMPKVLLGAMGILLLGVWVRCMMGNPPPQADTVDKTILIGETVVPTDFIENIHSESQIVSVLFAKEPNVLAHSNQIVEIIITDENDKSTTVHANLIIRLNREPPTIEGTGTIMSTLGNPIIYRQDVSARDDFGRPLELHVDSSEVNQHAVGVYNIRFSATDLTGNKAEVIEEVHIVNVDIDYVFGQVDAVLGDITNNDMSQLEKVRAIHSWIRTNIAYASVIGGPETVYEDAYRALRDRRGNCYIFYAIGEVMLTRAGIENMPIDRIPGTPTRHRWSLINPDYLGWHHFDTTPTRLGLGAETAFFTDTQAKDFTNRFVEFNGTQDFYTYNPELYPEIVR